MSWITCHLNNRKQFNNVNSSENIIKCGIPQGSILGPLLFILYINDIANASNLLRFILFSDDINVYYSRKNTSDANNVLNQEMEKVSDWLIKNQLSINLNLILKPRQKCLNLTNFSLKIKNNLIERKSSIKFLGVIIDEHLSWKEHISTVAAKISKSIGIVSKSRFYISNKSLFMLYYALVYPYLYYGNIIWVLLRRRVLHYSSLLRRRANARNVS